MQTFTEEETWAVLRLSYWHLQRRRFRSAERLARGLLRLDIKNGWAWYYYGESRRHQGDPGEAQKGYLQAARLLDRPQIWLRLAEVLLATGDRREAQNALREVARCDEDTRFNGRVSALRRRMGSE
jgi:tetratricopeptide (TPR) repeat protein